MNILVLNWRDPKNPNSGGAEIVTMEHAKGWVKAGHKVTWLTSSFKNSKNKEIIDEVEFLRRGNSYTVYLIAPIYYLISRNKFDIVIDEIHGIPFFTPLYARKPKIAFLHEVAGEIWHFMFPFPLNYLGILSERIYLWLYKSMPFWVDAESTVEELVSYGIKRENITAIPCPINNPVVSKVPQKEKVPTFIFVSRLVKMKGIENAMKAFALILNEMPQAVLWIVGTGETHYVNKLRKLAKDLSIYRQIIFYGHVSNEEKLELMGRSHLLLHASVKEGWGLVVLEAASQGTPSVVYNVSGLRDIINKYKTGVILDKNTPDQLAKELIKLYSDKRQYLELQSNGLKNVGKLKWNDSTKQSIDLLNKTIRFK